MISQDITKFRGETRRERYDRKNARIMPVSVATVNFSKEANIAYVVRAAACFGAFEVCLVGGMPNRDIMNDVSGSTYDYMSFKQFSTPEDFMRYCEAELINIIAFELPDENFDSISLNDFKFDFSKRSCIVVGHESIGVPVEILARAQRVFIDMPGVGHCLNTSQAANIGLYVASNQYHCGDKK